MEVHDGFIVAGLPRCERRVPSWRPAGTMAQAAGEDFLARIDWVVAQLEATFPNARAFVRAGLDEPDEVARLATTE